MRGRDALLLSKRMSNERKEGGVTHQIGSSSLVSSSSLSSLVSLATYTHPLCFPSCLGLTCQCRGRYGRQETLLVSLPFSGSVFVVLWWLSTDVQHPSPSCTGAGLSRVMIWSPVPVPVTCPVEFPAGRHNPW